MAIEASLSEHRRNRNNAETEQRGTGTRFLFPEQKPCSAGDVFRLRDCSGGPCPGPAPFRAVPVPRRSRSRRSRHSAVPIPVPVSVFPRSPVPVPPPFPFRSVPVPPPFQHARRSGDNKKAPFPPFRRSRSRSRSAQFPFPPFQAEQWEQWEQHEQLCEQYIGIVGATQRLHSDAIR